MLVSQCLENIRRSFPFEGSRSFSCDVKISTVNLEFVHVRLLVTLDDYVERKGLITMKNSTSNLQQNVYADHFSGLTKPIWFTIKFVEGDGKELCFAQVLLFLHLDTLTMENISGGIVFLTNFEIKSCYIHFILLWAACVYDGQQQTSATTHSPQNYEQVTLLA